MLYAQSVPQSQCDCMLLYLPILPWKASWCVVSCSMFVRCTKQVVHFTACMPVTPPYSVFTAERDEEARQREYLTSCPLTSCCYYASYMHMEPIVNSIVSIWVITGLDTRLLTIGSIYQFDKAQQCSNMVGFPRSRS